VLFLFHLDSLGYNGEYFCIWLSYYFLYCYAHLFKRQFIVIIQETFMTILQQTGIQFSIAFVYSINMDTLKKNFKSFLMHTTFLKQIITGV